MCCIMFDHETQKIMVIASVAINEGISSEKMKTQTKQLVFIKYLVIFKDSDSRERVETFNDTHTCFCARIHFIRLLLDTLRR